MAKSSSSIRIRVVIGSLDVGGTETHLVRLLPDLAAEGFIISVLTLTHKGHLADDLECENITVYAPPRIIRILQRTPLLSRLTAPIGTLVYLSYIFMRKSADISCFYLPSSYYLGMLAHMVTGDKSRTIMFRRSLNDYQRGRFLIKLYERWLHEKVDMIVGNSKAVVEQLITAENVVPDKLRLIYNGVDLSDLHSNGNKHVSVREELQIDDNILVMTIVANLIPYKGHMDLILALSSFDKNQLVPWKLLVVGDGLEARSDLVSLVNSHNLEEHIYWLGLRRDISKIYSETDIGLLVSHQESFSNAIIEGMAAGVPMIVTNVGGNKEAVVHEQCGLVIEPHNPEQIASAIARLSNDKVLRESYGKNARARVHEKFSSAQTLAEYIGLFGSDNNII